MSRVALLVPLKDFGGAKGRLGDVLPRAERSALMRELASGVLAAGQDLDRWVVCDRVAVAEFGLLHGAQVIWRGGGLNPAVQAALERLRSEGYSRAVIAHGDLAGVSSFDPFLEAGDHCVAVAPDRRLDGTNVLSTSLANGFRVAYGPGSLVRHRAEAERLGIRFSVVHDDAFSLDVDTVDDLNLYRSRNRAVRLT